MMALDNRSANRYAYSHTIILRCIEGFEKSVYSLRVQTDSRIFHAKPHTIAFASFGSDQQLPRTVVDGAHRVGCVPDKVQDNLLKLNAISVDEREVSGKFSS